MNEEDDALVITAFLHQTRGIAAAEGGAVTYVVVARDGGGVEAESDTDRDTAHSLPTCAFSCFSSIIHSSCLPSASSIIPCDVAAAEEGAEVVVVARDGGGVEAESDFRAAKSSIAKCDEPAMNT